MIGTTIKLGNLVGHILLNNIKLLEDCFFDYNLYLENVDIPNVQLIKNYYGSTYDKEVVFLDGMAKAFQTISLHLR